MKKAKACQIKNKLFSDFLKELDLTEGRGTSFPKMNKKPENNGSP